MIIIYYRNKHTGRIMDAHTARAGQTMADIAPLIVKFNAEATSTRTAVAAEVPDDSLEAYLYNQKNERVKADKKAVEDAIEALQEALSAVRYLEG